MAIARRASMGENRDSSSSSYRSSQFMRLPRILNQCHPIPGFVYGRASFAEDAQTVLIPVRPRKRSTATSALARNDHTLLAKNDPPPQTVGWCIARALA